jgi:cation/acetate symporter
LAGALGGPILLGFISAVAFATILAVVAGLTLAGASAVSHDIYGQVMARGRASETSEVMVAKIAAVAIGIVAVGLAVAFENQNVAFMAGLALSVAASCNFPVLAMAIFWRGTTTRGAVVGGLAGLVASVSLVVLSKTVWVALFHFATAPFPYDNPALFSMPLAFLGIWVFSVTDRSARAVRERKAFAAQFVQSETGITGAKQPGLAAATS